MSNKKIIVVFRTILLLLLIFYVLAGNSQVLPTYHSLFSTSKAFSKDLPQRYSSNGRLVAGTFAYRLIVNNGTDNIGKRVFFH